MHFTQSRSKQNRVTSLPLSSKDPIIVSGVCKWALAFPLVVYRVLL